MRRPPRANASSRRRSAACFERAYASTGAGRAEDFTEIAFAGEAPQGQIVAFRVTGHDGSRVLAERVA